ncbi:heme biosynthesis protein HemY [Neotabrizicola sp. VNH66]|uniref:heme biosynthesis protein HemY n=1 Tax=Neotabrizicola sp. VNH66 TaxID=3400918 RepID=UPI003C0B95F6
MLWSLAKVVLFLCIVAALALFGASLSETGGTLRLWVFNQEFTLGPLAGIIALALLLLAMWLILRLSGLLVATFRFLNGDETALSRHFDRSRERRGYQALSEGLIALAGGETTLAMARAKTAERLLHKPELTALLTAQAAEASGDSRTATEAWKQLLGHEETRFVAVRGLMRQKLAEGDTSTALKLAERALALKPRHSETQDIVLKLQTEGGDWRGARQTLSEKLRTGELPRSVYRRRDALLALQEAKTILDEGSTPEARDAAIEANKLSPDLIPAATLAARAMIDKGDIKGATRVLKKAWEAQPHPDLAGAFAEIAPTETPAERLRRFDALLSRRPDHEETRLTRAELLLAAEDFTAAEAALGAVPEDHPTQRALAILAAARRGQGAPDEVVRELLARALTAPRGPEWCCEACAATHDRWGPVCSSCNGFDTLVWKDADRPHALRPALRPELAPLLFAPALGIQKPAPVAEPVAEEVVEPEPAPPKSAPQEPDLPPPGLTPDEILRRVN